MRLVISQFMSLDGLVQAPGGPEEDTDGGFPHVMGGFIDEAMQETEALLFGRRTWQTMDAAWPDRDDGSDPFATTAASGVLCCVYRPGQTPPMPDREG
jgi:dihydrofolate reductase